MTEVRITDEMGLTTGQDFVSGQYDIIRFSRIIAMYATTNRLLVNQIHTLNKENFQLRQRIAQFTTETE
jgi:hypothetical protein